MWLQVRDVYATEKELTGRGVPIAREATPGAVGSARDARRPIPTASLLIFVQVPETHPLRRDTRN